MSSRRKKKPATDHPALEADAPASGHPIEEIQGHAPGGQVHHDEAGPQSGPQPTSSDSGEEFHTLSNNVDKPTPDAVVEATPIDHHQADPKPEPATTPDAARGGDPTIPAHVGSVDLPYEPGNSFAEVFLDLLDAGGEGPTCPANELLGPPDQPLVLPDEGASNEDLIDGARRLVQIVSWRMRRSVQEWWLIGCHLTILKSRPENEGQWRKEILPQIGINHTTDHQLRAMAQKIPFERCLDFGSKYEALKSIGFFAAPEPVQLGGPKAEPVVGEPRVQAGFEGIFGIEGEETFTLDDLGGPSLPQAFPIEEAGGQVDEDSEPPVGGLADEDAQPQAGVPGEVQSGAVAEHKAQPKVEGKEKDQPRAKQGDAKAKPTKLAAKPIPQTEDEGADANVQGEDEDPIAVGEALVVTLGGAKVADMEAALSNTPFSVIARTEKRVVGLLWYAEDDYDRAKDKAGEALERLKDVKQNFLVEARYLRPLEVLAL